MEYIYAALLLHRAGKKVDEEGLRRVVEAAGITPDLSRIKSLAAVLAEVNIDEVLKQAAYTPAAPAAAPAPAQTPAQAPAEKPKEEEKKEEESLSGLSALFG